MKKFIIIFSVFLFTSFNILIVPSMAQPVTVREGFYEIEDLKLSPNTIYTIQNNSPNEYAAIIIFDSNQVTRQFIRLNPQSEKYNLPPMQAGFQIIIVGNDEVTIS